MKRNNLVKRLVMQYFTALFGLFCVLVAFVFAMRQLCYTHVWYGTEFWYPLLHRISRNLTSVTTIACLTGWLFITMIFAVRMWLYLRDVVGASEQMALHTEIPVKMSESLMEIQYEMNCVREQVLFNKRMVKEAEQKKNDMIIYLAHDLKTPLTSVIGYLTLLKDEPELSTDKREYYTKIAYDKAVRLEQLINEFFEITRFQLTRMTLEKTPINLSRMLEQTASEFLPVMEEKSLSWELSIEPDINISCDPDKLARVFDNLIRNAIFYSYVDSTLKLAMSRVENNVWIRLENPGKTIPKDKISHIFEQFYRLDESRSTSTGGAGLGLAIVKEIVELHGGHIEAESEEDTIRFFLWLPVTEKIIVM